MTLLIQFCVLGNPAPQGSKKIVPTAAGARLIEVNDARKKQWRTAVAEAARDTHSGPPLVGPLELTVTFRFPMPKSRRKADQARGWCWKTSAPDSDKLLRAVGDALKIGGLVHDDALFVDTHVQKIEVTGWIGADIQVTEAHPA
jgi:Holliday junction resolvase RusA-like endonuclease